MNDNSYEFSYAVEAVLHEPWETPLETEGQSVPLDIFSHSSTLQALSRYLVDHEGLSFTDTGKLLQRSVKTIWASYHQMENLPTIDEATLRIPVRIFSEGLPPLEALVRHLRTIGFRNKEIATTLNLSPKTTSTVFKRAEVRQ